MTEKRKSRRGFKDKVVLTLSLSLFDPRTIKKAYEEGEDLFLVLDNGDELKSQSVHLCEDEDAAWNLYAAHIEETTGKTLVRRTN